MTRRIVAVSAGLSEPSSTRLLADRLAAATQASLAQQVLSEQVRDGHVEIGRVEVEHIELREHAVDLAHHLVTGFASGDLAATLEQVTSADGLVLVSPIFNASYNGLFKTFVDVLPVDGLVGMPTLLGATGGTARHSLALDHALRPLFTYLRAVVVPTGVYAATEDWASAGRLTERIERGAAELAALVAARTTAAAADPYAAGALSFASLLTDRRP